MFVLFVNVGLQICQKVASGSLRHMYIHMQRFSTRTRREDTLSKLPLLESVAHNYNKSENSEVTHLTAPFTHLDWFKSKQIYR